MVRHGHEGRLLVETQLSDTGALDAESDAGEEAGVVADISGIEDTTDTGVVDYFCGTRGRGERDTLCAECAVAAAVGAAGKGHAEVLGEGEGEALWCREEVDHLTDAAEGLLLAHLEVGVLTSVSDNVVRDMVSRYSPTCP